MLKLNKVLNIAPKIAIIVISICSAYMLYCMVSIEISFYIETSHGLIFDQSIILYLLSVIVIPILLFVLSKKLKDLYFSISVLALVLFYIIYNFIDWLSIYIIPALILHLIYLVLVLIYLSYKTDIKLIIVNIVYTILLLYTLFCSIGFLFELYSDDSGWPSNIEIILFHPMLCFSYSVYFLLCTVIHYKKLKE